MLVAVTLTTGRDASEAARLCFIAFDAPGPGTELLSPCMLRTAESMATYLHVSHPVLTRSLYWRSSWRSLCSSMALAAIMVSIGGMHDEAHSTLYNAVDGLEVAERVF